MTANAFPRAAMSRRNVIAGLIVLISIPTLRKGPASKAFLDEIYRHYVGDSTSDAKGIALTNAKAVRAYFTVGLASLIIEDRTLEIKRSEPPVLEGDPFVGHRQWDISKFWDLASTKFRAAFAKIAPQLKPFASILPQIAAGAGTGAVKFFVAIVVAGFLFSPAPMLVNAITMFSRRLASERGKPCSS
jgi:hypothetical protein